MAMGHVILKEFYSTSAAPKDDHAPLTDMPNLVPEERTRQMAKVMVPGHYLRASDFNGKLARQQPLENRD